MDPELQMTSLRPTASFTPAFLCLSLSLQQVPSQGSLVALGLHYTTAYNFHGEGVSFTVLLAKVLGLNLRDLLRSHTYP